MTNILNKQLKQTTREIRLTANDNNLIKDRLPRGIYLVSIDSIKDLGMKHHFYLKEVTYTHYLPTTYEELVNQMVREKYPVNEEFAILRKAINGITDEYLIYNAYVEDCKAQAKAFIKERNKIVEV